MKNLCVKLSLLSLLALVWNIPALQAQDYDVVILNGRVMDPETGFDAVANVGVQDGKVAVITGDAITGRETVDVRGHVVAPGFIDTHVHFLDGGEALESVQLRDVTSREQFRQRFTDYVATIEPGEWILGGTWDHEAWGGELPTRDWIDDLTADNPVWVSRLDGHMALANSLALSLAGVDADSPDVPGGEIVRDTDGRPTGVLKDNAMTPVFDAVPPPTEVRRDRQLRAALEYLAANGAGGARNGNMIGTHSCDSTPLP